jgi:hypothetical protein
LRLSEAGRRAEEDEGQRRQVALGVVQSFHVLSLCLLN